MADEEEEYLHRQAATYGSAYPSIPPSHCQHKDKTFTRTGSNRRPKQIVTSCALPNISASCVMRPTKGILRERYPPPAPFLSYQLISFEKTIQDMQRRAGWPYFHFTRRAWSSRFSFLAPFLFGLSLPNVSAFRHSVGRPTLPTA